VEARGGEAGALDQHEREADQGEDQDEDEEARERLTARHRSTTALHAPRRSSEHITRAHCTWTFT
jgi:hypothetical protein